MIKKLLEFVELCKKETEWGGFINQKTGKIEGPVDGGKQKSFPLPPRIQTFEMQRAASEAGWKLFHTHVTGIGVRPRPSRGDAVVAHISGGPEYVVTIRGIWEVKPVKILPIDDLLRLSDEAQRQSRRSLFDSKVDSVLESSCILDVLDNEWRYYMGKLLPSVRATLLFPNKNFKNNEYLPTTILFFVL